MEPRILREPTSLSLAVLFLAVLFQLAILSPDLQAECMHSNAVTNDMATETTEPSWSSSHDQAAKRLADAGPRWIGVIEEAAARVPDTEAESFVRLSVLLRAGLEAEAVAALDDLHGGCPRPAPETLVDLFEEASDREAWTVAGRLPEIFEFVEWDGYIYELIDHWQEDERRPPEEIAEWLAARQETSSHHQSSKHDLAAYWLRVRLTFLSEHGIHEPLMGRIEDEIYADPTDVRALLRYLHALPIGLARERDMAWLSDRIEPATATDAYDLGRAFERFEQWSAAAPFYRAAIAIPWTDEDARLYARFWSAAVSTEQAEARFHEDVRERLSRAQLALGEAPVDEQPAAQEQAVENDEDMAVALLREKIANTTADSHESLRAVNSLLGFSVPWSPDDPLLWGWLDARVRWGWPETSLLRRLLEAGAQAKGETGTNDAVERALRLTDGGHWSRAYATGSWLKQRGDDDARAIPLLRRALELTDDANIRSAARRSLGDALADAESWRLAERVAMESSTESETDEVRRGLVEAALSAARAGAHADALRLWSSAMPIDLAATDGLEELAENGLREDLVDLYREVAARLPTSNVPGRALTLLAQAD